MSTMRTTGQTLSNQGCPKISKTGDTTSCAYAMSSQTKTQKQGNLMLCLFPKTSRSFISDMPGTLSRSLRCRCGNLSVPPKMLCIMAVMNRQCLSASPFYQNNCTGHRLVLGTRQQHGKHVGQHLHWQSRDELTQLFPPSLILDRILRVTEKNTLARNGDNSAWGGKCPQSSIGQNFEVSSNYTLYTPLLSPRKMLGVKTYHLEPFTHQ